MSPLSKAALEGGQVKYELRLVAFLDILGFKEWVAESSSDPSILVRITELIDAIRKMNDGSQDFFEEIDPSDKRLTQFSDSLVISYRLDASSAVFYLLLDLLFVVLEAASRGFLFRGGIAVGEMLHTDDHVVGPALVEAYRLESKVAIFPRVIVDPEGRDALLRAASQYPAAHHDGKQENRYVESLLTEDEDGNFFLDFVSFEGAVVTVGIDSEAYPG